MRKRVFVSGLFHETNTFVERPTPHGEFTLLRGAELQRCAGDGSPLDGFLQASVDHDWEAVYGIDCRRNPSGTVSDDLFETFWAEFLERLREALLQRVDAVFLILHGAIVTVSHPDVEGELLERIRSIPGAERLPLVVLIDLHANVSERMVKNASILVPYRENPHIDARETALRAAAHLNRMLITGEVPRSHYSHSGILLAPSATGTADLPMRRLNELARESEKSFGHWEVGIAAGIAHADTRDTGLSFWVSGIQPESDCLETLDLLVSEALMLAGEMKANDWELAEALDHIASKRRFPALLVEASDNIGGGTPGDCTFVLRALLERPIGRSGVVLNDPEAAGILHTRAVGDRLRIALGGKGSSLDPGPVDIEITLQSLSNGCFDLEDEQSHLASMGGRHIDMGPSAVVTH